MRMDLLSALDQACTAIVRQQGDSAIDWHVLLSYVSHCQEILTSTTTSQNHQVIAVHEAIKQAAALATTRIQLREQQPQQEASSMDVLAQTRVESSYDDAGFERIIGSHAAKQTLKEAITLPTVLPELFQGIRQPWRKILLYGPPGTGKTMLAKAVAREVQGNFHYVSSADIISSWLGESEKLIRELFQGVRRSNQLGVIFIDEVDSLCRKRNEKEDDTARRIKTELLHQIEYRENEANVILLCATNCPWELDPAFLRRFQKQVFVDLPSIEERILMLTALLEGIAHALTNDDIRALAELTERYFHNRYVFSKATSFSGSDIRHLVSDVSLQPIREAQTASTWTWTVNEAGSKTASPRVSQDTFTENSFHARLEDIVKDFKINIREVQLADFEPLFHLHFPTITQEEYERFRIYATSRY